MNGRARFYSFFPLPGLLIADMMFGVTDAYASGNNFSNIAQNIISSISQLPSLLSGLAYMMGVLFGVLGILKIKDHVDNPSTNKLQEGAIRLASGGALFGLPIIYEAMLTTIGHGTAVSAPALNPIQFN